MSRFAWLALAVGACTSTFTVPPGSEKQTVLGAFLGSENRIMADIMKYGFPDTQMLRYREGYVLSYDARNKVPRWTAERLNAKRLVRTFERPAGKFREDQSLAPEHRSENEDYAGSPYVRGRIASAGNQRNDLEAFEQTFYLSNVCPMMGEYFRQTVWVRLEQKVRRWASESDNLYIVTGPLFVPQTDDEGNEAVRYETIGDNRVGVPTHFFKVLLRELDGQKTMLAFLLPHRRTAPDADLDQFLVSVDKVERLSGLNFFPKLSEPTQGRLEAVEAETTWPISGVPRVPVELDEDEEMPEEPMEAPQEEPEEPEEPEAVEPVGP